MSIDFEVIGIGASAGGLEAIEALLTRIPPNTGKAFIVIQHLSPDFKSFMPEILAQKTEMQIPVIEDGIKIKPNLIYLIPPKKNLTLNGESLSLHDIERTKVPNRPIDLFFESLASLGTKAVAVVLSGTGSDGSLGIQAIKHHGGKVYVESPESARFDGMPTNAIATNCANFVGTPEEIAVKLRGSFLPHRMGLTSESPGPVHEESDRYKILHLIQEHYGVNFGHYKIATVNRRIDRRLQELKLSSLHKYLNYIRKNPKEISYLYYEMLIGVTQFFRDEEAFLSLANVVIPKLVKEAEEEIRIWVPGCASGEEAYSIAILVHEETIRQKSDISVKIFATDIDDIVLSKAASGVFTKEALAGVSKQRIEEYFMVFQDAYKISPRIRKSVVFARHNVLVDPPFTKLDLISCRNLLIYLGEQAQSAVRSSFCLALKESGFLFLGPSEAIGKFEVIFEQINKRWKIFRKVSSQRIPRDFQYQVLKQRGSFAYNRQTGLGSEDRQKDISINRAMNALLQAYVPPSILITEDLNLLHVFGDMGMHLHFKPGQTNLNLSNMLDERLLSAISITIQRVKKQNRPISYTNIAIDYGNETNLFDLLVRPVYLEKKSQTSLFLAAISESKTPADSIELANNSTSSSENNSKHPESNYSKEEADLLRDELRRTKEDLQATIEELETTNEELQSTNEEMLAANEELQSTNEELHSVNEELYSVNAEYQNKIEELIQLSQDEANLLECTQIATVFLDSELRVRKFTPSISAHFNLLPLDVGRPFSHITHNIKVDDFDTKLKEVLETSKTIEIETSSGDHYFILRLLPYMTGENTSDGVVLTFTDINEIKRASQNALETAQKAEAVSKELQKRTSDLELSAHKLQAMKDLYDRLFREIKIPIIIAESSEDGKIIDANYKALDLFTVSLDEMRLRKLPELLGDKLVHKFSQIFKELQNNDKGEAVYEFRTEIELRKIPRMVNIILSSIILDEKSCIQMVLRDITEENELQAMKEEAEQARRSTHFKSKFLANMSHEIRTPLNSLLGMSELLNETKLSSAQANYCQSILKAGETLLGIVNDILDLSKIESGEMSIERIEFDLNKIVEDVHDLLKTKAADKGLEFNLQFGENVPRFVIGDSIRIKQILINLLNNAIKFTERGEVSLSIRARFNNDNVNIKFIVADTGIGIPKKYHKSIFHSFNQADSSMTRRFGGTGLGLAIVKSLTEMMNGTIELSSEENKGTTFTIGVDLEAGSKKSHKGRILLISTNGPIIDTISKCLAKYQYECTTIDDSQSALQEIQHSKYDVILHDFHGKSQNDLDLFAKLRSLGVTSAFVLITEKGNNLSFSKAKEVDLFDVISTPIDPDNLFTVLSDAVSKVRDSNFDLMLQENLNNIPALDVLVVEDVHYNRTMLEAFLSDTPFNLTFAENGKQALECSKEKSFDVILMDIQMPIMDGYEATKEIRKHEGTTKHTPIIALTAHALEEEKRKCLASGCDSYLTKPVKKKMLIKTILEQTNYLN